MLSSRLGKYDPSTDDVLNHTTELIIRLRIIATSFFITILLVLFFPTTWLWLDFNSEYRPFVLSALDFLLKYSTSNITTDNFAITAGSPLAVITELFIIALVISFVINYPLILYQIYLFIAPGLYPIEERILKRLVSVGTLLFMFGAFFGFQLMPIVTNTLVGLAGLLEYENFYQFYDLSQVVDFLVWNVVATGLLFTYPILIIGLVFTGFLTVEDLEKRRRHVIVALVGLTAVITPDPTPVSMIILSVPLILLFEISINFAYKIQTSPDFIEMRERVRRQWESSKSNVLDYGNN